MSKKVQELDVPKGSSLIEKIWGNTEDIRNAIGMHILEIKTAVREIKTWKDDIQELKKQVADIYNIVKTFDEKLKAINMGIADILDPIEEDQPTERPEPPKPTPSPTKKGSTDPFEPYYEIIIHERGLSREDIDQKVKDIIVKTNGLISREGAFKQVLKLLNIPIEN